MPIAFSFCGGRVVNGVCEVHHQAALHTDCIVGNVCMLYQRLQIKCAHSEYGKSKVLNIPSTALPALLGVAGVACELVRSQEAALDVLDLHERLEATLHETETSRLEKRNKATPSLDRVAVEAMRSGRRPPPPYGELFTPSKN